EKSVFLIGVMICIFISFFGCRSPQEKNGPPLFSVLETNQTGLNFSNKLSPTQQFNVFNYMYFYNGGGVGAGDFNNDGKIDLFFASNQQRNKIFLNTGNLQFKDVTVEAGIPDD